MATSLSIAFRRPVDSVYIIEVQYTDIFFLFSLLFITVVISTLYTCIFTVLTMHFIYIVFVLMLEIVYNMVDNVVFPLGNLMSFPKY